MQPCFSSHCLVLLRGYSYTCVRTNTQTHVLFYRITRITLFSVSWDTDLSKMWHFPCYWKQFNLIEAKRIFGTFEIPLVLTWLVTSEDCRTNAPSCCLRLLVLIKTAQKPYLPHDVVTFPFCERHVSVVEEGLCVSLYVILPADRRGSNSFRRSEQRTNSCTAFVSMFGTFFMHFVYPYTFSVALYTLICYSLSLISVSVLPVWKAPGTNLLEVQISNFL